MTTLPSQSKDPLNLVDSEPDSETVSDSSKLEYSSEDPATSPTATNIDYQNSPHLPSEPERQEEAFQQRQTQQQPSTIQAQRQLQQQHNHHHRHHHHHHHHDGQQHDEPIYVPTPVHRNLSPKKSILKQPPPPKQGFSFKRDILDPLNSRISYDNVPPPAAAATTFFRQAIGRFAAYPQTTASPPTMTTTTSSSSFAHAPVNTSPINSENTHPQSPTTQSSFNNVSNSSITTPPKKSNSMSMEPLKSVRFTMSSLAVVYPIGGPTPPGKEAETRDRINSEYRAKNLLRASSSHWKRPQLLELYEECCRSREERPLRALRRAFLDNNGNPPPAIDLTHVTLNPGTALALSDILSVNWRLQKLVLEDCGLTDESIKPILHGLLVSGSLPFLSLADNKRIRSRGWRLVSIFIRRATALNFLDVSNNNFDRRSLEGLIQAISEYEAEDSTAVMAEDYANVSSPLTSESSMTNESNNEPKQQRSLTLEAELLRDNQLNSKAAVKSIRMDGCNLKVHQLETLAKGIRISDIENLSLRNNRITSFGAVALALLMRDYEHPSDPSVNDPFTSIDDPPTPESSPLARSVSSFNAGNTVTARQNSTIGLNYKPMERTNSVASTSSPTSQDDQQQQQQNQALVFPTPESSRTKLLRQLDALPRIGNLVTLDVKSNDIRHGVKYIAQALKRNRTLKVLNLSDNKIDPAGLSNLAEALKYNTTLETLYLNQNPCSGPSLEGINNLRSALMYNTNILRLFLSNTDMTSEGAISLAEFLPEVKSLFHLDLTENYEIDIAGVMALSVSVKLNKTLRCLDLNIPPNAPDFARLSQEILQSCVRNTELAQEELNARGINHSISAPIHKSAIVRDLRQSEKLQEQRQKAQVAAENAKVANSNANLPSSILQSRTQNNSLMVSAIECKDVLVELIKTQSTQQGPASKDEQLISLMNDIIGQAQAAKVQLLEAIGEDPAARERNPEVMTLCNDIEDACEKANRLLDPQTLILGEGVPPQTPEKPPANNNTLHKTNNDDNNNLKSPTSSEEIDRSPVFSITDSDDESEGEGQQQQNDRTSDSSNKITKQSDSKSAPHQDEEGESIDNSEEHHYSDSDSASENGDHNDHNDDEDEEHEEHENNVKDDKQDKIKGKNKPVLKSLDTDNINLDSPNVSRSPRSPIENQSRTLTLEEGEVFRKGAALGAADLSDDEDISGEQLKKEILEAEVDKSPRSSISNSDVNINDLPLNEESSTLSISPQKQQSLSPPSRSSLAGRRRRSSSASSSNSNNNPIPIEQSSS